MLLGCHHSTPAVFTPEEIFLVRVLLEADPTPRPEWGREDNTNEKFQWAHQESIPASFRIVAACPQNHENIR
jgi:hypothetical protein